MTDVSFVRHEPLPAEAPPTSDGGPVQWMRANLFNSWFNGILTLLVLWILFEFVTGVWPWFANSVWTADSLAQCREIDTGACFAVIQQRWNQFLFGFYPSDEYWRPTLTFVLMLGAIAPVLFQGCAAAAVPADRGLSRPRLLADLGRQPVVAGRRGGGHRRGLARPSRARRRGSAALGRWPLRRRRHPLAATRSPGR